MRELVVYGAGREDRKALAGRVAAVFAEHLAKNGLRLTGQRRLILDQLLKADHHLSQDEIRRALRPQGVGRATVFRTLKMLQECGLVSPVVGRDGSSRFEVELDRPHHDHLICVDCGRIQEVRWPELEKIQDEACRKAGFRPKWHRHEVFGLCRDCADRAIRRGSAASTRRQKAADRAIRRGSAASTRRQKAADRATPLGSGRELI